MNKLFGLILGTSLWFHVCALAATEGMSQMPHVKPASVYVIPNKEAGEELQENRGYGANEPMVRMMNLMMVEGSGYEGMDMGSMANSGAKPADQPPGNGHRMMMASSTPDSAQLSQNSTSKISWEAKTTSGSAKVGVNKLILTARDSTTKNPMKGLKPLAQVYMKSMDMGTTSPRVKETAPGVYQVEVNFTMQGPWAVKITARQEMKEFEFDVVEHP